MIPSIPHPGRALLLVLLASALNFIPITLPGEARFYLGPFVYMPLVLALPQPWAVLAAAIPMAVTIDPVGNPFPFLLMAGEAIWLSVGRRRVRGSPVLQDGVYWLLVGLPVVIGLTHGIARLPAELVAIMAGKQLVNQLAAVVGAVFLLRHTGLGGWLADLPTPHRRMRDIVFHSVFVLAMIPLAFAAVGVSVLLWAYCEREDREVLAGIGQRSTQQLDLFADTHVAAVTMLANTLGRRGGDPVTLLEETRRAHPSFLSVMVTDAAGRTLHASPPPQDPAALISVADRSYFQQARDRDQPFISGVFRSRGFQGQIIIAVSAPIHDADGKFAGVVEGSLEVGEFAHRIVGNDRKREIASILADPTGRVIFSHRTAGLPPLAALRHFPQGALLAREADDQPMRFDQPDATGRNSRLTAYLTRSGKAGFIVIAQRPLLAGLEGSGWLIALFGGVVAGTLGVAGWVTHATRRRAADPLEYFAANANRQALQRAVESMEDRFVDAPYEVGIIFRSFNRLAVQLQGTYEQLRQTNRELDQRVNERTAEAEAARQHAEAANQSKSEFLAMTGHEIRTPLNAILGLTDALIETATDPRALEHLHTIHHSSQRLLKVLNELLDLSKIEAGKLELRPAPVELDTLCRELSALFMAPAEQQNVRFEIEFGAPQPLWVHADGGRLRQVLINLVGNALKFTSVGRVCVSVETMWETPRETTLRFAVRDTGPGIALEEQARLFQPYVQLESSRAGSGTGLGLVISQRLVGLMGSELKLCSEPGYGAEFFFTLVLARVAGPEMTPVVPITTAPAPRPRVLAVDDNAVNQEVLRSMLETQCAHLTLVDNADAALAELERAEFDVALIDLEMPVKDGFSVARTVRAWTGVELSRGCRLVACSAHRRDEIWSRCAANGFDDFVEKPVDRGQLLHALRQGGTAGVGRRVA